MLLENVCCLKNPSSSSPGLCSTCVCPCQVTGPMEPGWAPAPGLLSLNPGASLGIPLPSTAPTAWSLGPSDGTPCPQPALALRQPVASPHPTFPAPLPIAAAPLSIPTPFCFSLSTDLQQVPINNFKWSPIFLRPRQ